MYPIDKTVQYLVSLLSGNTTLGQGTPSLRLSGVQIVCTFLMIPLDVNFPPPFFVLRAHNIPVSSQSDE